MACTLAVVTAYAQTVVYGTVQAANDKTGLPAASVVLKQNADAKTTATLTDTDGNFRLERIASGQYTLEVNYLGYRRLVKSFQVQNKPVALGTLLLEEETTAIREVQIVGRAPLGEQKGDTSQFNTKAFKTTSDASVEELVTKMPGVTIQNGTVQAQGEDVKQVMIDGKRYTGEDVSVAMRNLSADMIEHVQVFDGQSDRAAFSGFDDGNKVKTLNFITKKELRQGYAGKVSAGYGTDGRYMLGASLNYFNNNRRITLTGLTNNINMTDFSIGETPGGSMRGRRGRWGASAPTGMSNTHTIGLNYTDLWGRKIEVSGNYTYLNSEVTNDQRRFRDYVSNEAGLQYSESSLNNRTEDQHRFNFRLQYNINQNNRLLVSPGITLQQNKAITERSARTYDDGGTLATSFNRNTAENVSLDFRNNILYSHRFGTTGRILTANLNTSYSNTDEDTYLAEDTENFQNPARSADRDQHIRLSRNNLAWSGNLDYSEQLGQNSRLQLEYTVGNQQNDSDRRTFDAEENTGTYTSLNVPLSHTFTSDYVSQNIGPSYQYRTDKVRLQADVRYQYATLQGNSAFPKSSTLKRSFSNVLPSAEYEYTFSPAGNLSLSYRTSTHVPSVEQLQDVLDISNPLQPRLGNPALNQEYQHRLRLRYRNFNAETNRVFFVGLFGTMAQDYMANSVYTTGVPANPAGEFALQPGARLSRPVNMDGYWNVRSFVSYGQPLNLISSNIHFNASVGFSRIPGMVDGAINYANTTNLRAGVNLSSNISEKVDFTLSSSSSFNKVDNTLRTTQNNNYFTQNTSLRYNWTPWKGLVYRTELTHQYNSGLSAGVDNSYLLWNMSLGKKVFKSRQGEISLSVNDLLQQNLSVERNITADYVEDVQATVLQRFFMLTFTYNLRNFKGGTPPDPEQSKTRRWGGQ